MSVDTHSAQGSRPEHEGRQWSLESGDKVIMAIADGFPKENQRGGEIAQIVVDGFRREFAGQSGAKLKVEPWRAFLEIFSVIQNQTRFCFAGSTLTAAWIELKKTQVRVQTAILGDSLIVAGDIKNIWTEPENKIDQGELKLWDFFGDYYNRDRHRKTPSQCTFQLDKEGACVLAASGGLFPTQDAGEIKHFGYKYLTMAQGGASAREIVEEAYRLGATDNTTLLLWRA